MTRQEKIDGNRLIAEFMGVEFGHDEQPKVFVKYHASWQWLMPVLEKLCKKEIGDGIKYVKYATPRTFGMLNPETGQIMVRLDGFQLQQADTLIEATFKAIVDVIKWLNLESH
jgi:hypothetical protein